MLGIDLRQTQFQNPPCEIAFRTSSGEKRVRKVLEVVGNRKTSKLNIGSLGWVGRALGIEDSTVGNLNWELGVPSEMNGEEPKKYQLIYCLEVIEHIQNPLLMLTLIKRLMTPTSSLIITTPTRSPWLQDPVRHFAEYDWEQLRSLLIMAGLTPVHHETFLHWRWWTFFAHPIRYFFTRTHLIIARGDI